jgi:hypothetical protein
MRVAAPQAVTGLALSLALLISGPAAAGSEVLRFKRLDGEGVNASLERPAGSRKVPLLIVLHDRPCGRAVRDPPPRLQTPPGVARLEIAPKPPEALPAGCLQAPTEARVLDVLTAVAALRTEAPWWNRRLYLAGASEGALAALNAASLTPETRGVVLLDPPPGAAPARGTAAGLAGPVLVLQRVGVPRFPLRTGGRVTHRQPARTAVQGELEAFLLQQEGRPQPRQVVSEPPAPAQPTVAARPRRTAGRAASVKDGPETASTRASAAAPARTPPKADAPPRPAKAATVRRAAAAPSRPAAPPAGRLRAKLPAGPDLPPATRPPAPRT